MLRMLTGVFALLARVFGRRRVAATPRGTGFAPAMPAPSAEWGLPPELKLRRAAAWHGEAALACRTGGDHDGERIHRAHAERYWGEARMIEERRRAESHGSTRVRVRCPRCLASDEYEITTPPERFRYSCRNPGCPDAQTPRRPCAPVRDWDRALCEVVPGRPGGAAESARNAADPPPDSEGEVWVTGKGKRIRPADMGDGHLVNTIRYVRRVAAARLTAARRAAPYDEMHGEDVPGMLHYIGRRRPAYEAMVREAARRGLEV